MRQVLTVPGEPHRTTILHAREPEELVNVFAPQRAAPCDAVALARDLALSLQNRHRELCELSQNETGLVPHDAVETIDGCIAFLQGFESRAPVAVPAPSMNGRRVEIHSVPWGTVVVILPQNAFLFLGLVALLHALDCGNRVVLRIPSGSMGTAAILADCLGSRGNVDLVGAGAKDLLDAFFASPTPGLVHYFGGSGRIPNLMAAAFQAGKGLIADGEGNTWVYVGEGSDPSWAAEILVAGSTRYNGQTCTSVNGALIHPSIYDEVVELARDRMGSLIVGDLAGEKSAQWCLDSVLKSGGDILVGGRQDGAHLDATLVVAPDFGSALVREGLFGPAMWVASGTEADFRRLWPSNRFPLCAAVLGPSADASAWTGLGNLARLVVNGDPSLEDPLEPWGGYPSSGNSPVSNWHEKYRRTVQVDMAAKAR